MSPMWGALVFRRRSKWSDKMNSLSCFEILFFIISILVINQSGYFGWASWPLIVKCTTQGSGVLKMGECNVHIMFITGWAKSPPLNLWKLWPKVKNFCVSMGLYWSYRDFALILWKSPMQLGFQRSKLVNCKDVQWHDLRNSWPNGHSILNWAGLYWWFREHGLTL